MQKRHRGRVYHRRKEEDRQEGKKGKEIKEKNAAKDPKKRFPLSVTKDAH